MLINYSEKTCFDSRISSEILHLAENNPQAKLKIIHNEHFDPFAYAIGFGNKANSNLIVGGINDNDWFSPELLLSFARMLCLTTSQNNNLLGIDINETFKSKGIWIIPKFNDADTSVAMNFIGEKLNPRQLFEIKPYGEKVSFYCPKRNETNTRLFAYILAASCNCTIASNILCAENENSLCKWFASELSRPAYSLSVGKYENLSNDDLEAVFNQILEGLILYTSS